MMGKLISVLCVVSLLLLVGLTRQTNKSYTGIASGGTQVVLLEAATYTAGTGAGSEAWGGLLVNNDNDVITVTLPSAVAGMNVCVANGNTVTAALTVDCDGSDAFVLDGVAGADGAHMASAGAAGDIICVTAISASQWLATFDTGTWSIP
jgi:hypothetical protein